MSGSGTKPTGCVNAGRDESSQHLLGADWSAGHALGLDKAWAAHAIAALSNFGEIYARTVGENSPLKLSRRLNALWMEGGVMHPLPVR